MSLFSYLNNDTGSTSSAADLALAAATQKVAAQRTAARTLETATTTAGAASSLQITLDAKRAAAAKADAGLDLAKLTSETRATLDAQYKASGSKTPSLSALSGRALAVVALNQGGAFSKAEVAAAKAEFKARDRVALMSEIAGEGLTASSIAAYRNSQLASRATMSAEELQYRATG